MRPGYRTYFDRWFNAQDRVWVETGADPLREREDVMIFLNALACALGPIRGEDLAALAGPTLQAGHRQRAIAQQISRFVLGDGQHGYAFSHPLLRDYFLDEMLPQESDDWKARYLAYGRRVLDQLSAGQIKLAAVPAYVVQHYSSHLERPGAPEGKLYDLVSEGWLRAWEAFEGTYSGFLTDVDRAWRLAEQKSDVGMQVRCAFCFSSVASLSANIAPQLLVAAAQHGPMSWPQALSLAYAKPDEAARMEALAALAPHLAEGERDDAIREVLVAARTIGDESLLAEVLVGVVPHLPEGLLAEVLAAAQAMGDEHHRAELLVSVVPYLPEGLLQEALVAARAIRREDLPAEALPPIVTTLVHASDPAAGDLWCQVLHVAAGGSRHTFLSCVPRLVPAIRRLGGPRLSERRSGLFTMCAAGGRSAPSPGPSSRFPATHSHPPSVPPCQRATFSLLVCSPAWRRQHMASTGEHRIPHSCSQAMAHPTTLPSVMDISAFSPLGVLHIRISREHQLKAIRIGRQWRIHEQDLEEYLERISQQGM